MGLFLGDLLFALLDELQLFLELLGILADGALPQVALRLVVVLASIPLLLRTVFLLVGLRAVDLRFERLELVVQRVYLLRGRLLPAGSHRLPSEPRHLLHYLLL